MREEEYGREVVAVARGWVGTPFHWGQAVKGVGCDCLGFVGGVAAELDRPEAVAVAVQNYRKVEPRRLKARMTALFDRVSEALPGDLLLIGINGKPMHLAIYCGDGRMIHTYSKGPGKVIEVPMRRNWSAAVDSIWRWRHDH